MNWKGAKRTLIIAVASIAIVAGIAWATLSNPQPAVGLYFTSTSDPTAGAGVAAPLGQLLFRQDVPSIYFKTGAANTAWTLAGTSASSGGTVTGTGTANTVTKWTGASSIGNSGVVDDSTAVSIASEPFSVGASNAVGLFSVNNSLGNGLVGFQIRPLDTQSEIMIETLNSGNVHTGATGDIAGIVVRDHVTFDTTLGNNASIGAALLVDSTRVAGAGLLSDKALEVSAVGGQANYAIDDLAGDIVMETSTDRATLGVTTTHGDTNLDGIADFTAGTIKIGTNLLGNVLSQIEMTGLANTTPQLGLGVINGDGSELCVKNNNNAQTQSGIEVQLDTTVLATSAGGLYMSRGAGGGGGIAGSVASAIAMAGANGSLMVGTKTNDLVLYDISGASIDFAADDSGFTTATRLTHFNHWVQDTSTGAPALDAGTCGAGGSQSFVGNDNRFMVTTGATSTSCTITFSKTHTTQPMCTITPYGVATLPTCTPSATQMVCATNIAATTYVFDCQGQPGST